MKPTGDISFLFVLLGRLQGDIKQASSELESESARWEVTVACRFIEHAKDCLLEAIEKESDS